jgi:hypothetical protein
VTRWWKSTSSRDGRAERRRLSTGSIAHPEQFVLPQLQAVPCHGLHPMFATPFENRESVEWAIAFSMTSGLLRAD